jgi:hypothetical protein
MVILKMVMVLDKVSKDSETAYIFSDYRLKEYVFHIYLSLPGLPVNQNYSTEKYTVNNGVMKHLL